MAYHAGAHVVVSYIVGHELQVVSITPSLRWQGVCFHRAPAPDADSLAELRTAGGSPVHRRGAVRLQGARRADALAGPGAYANREATGPSLVGTFWLQGTLVYAVEDVRDGRIDSAIGELFERARPYLAS